MWCANYVEDMATASCEGGRDRPTTTTSTGGDEYMDGEEDDSDSDGHGEYEGEEESDDGDESEQEEEDRRMWGQGMDMAPDPWRDKGE